MSPPSQEVYHSHHPKEKLHADSNNNENSVPKDFDSIDSNSNLGTRSQRERVANTKRLLDKVQAQSMLGKFPPVQPRMVTLNSSRLRKPHPQVPTVSAPATFLGSSRNPRLNQEKKTPAPPPGLEPRKEQPQCEISGKEAISALSRAKTRECRQQIAEVYCKHKDRMLMPEKVPRYCPREGESQSQCSNSNNNFHTILIVKVFYTRREQKKFQTRMEQRTNQKNVNEITIIFKEKQVAEVH